MTITEIKTKYANKSYIKVDEFKKEPYAKVNKLVDIINTDDIFLYTSVELDEFKATDLIIDFIINEAKSKLRETSGLFRREAISVIDDVVDEYKDELIKMCKIHMAKFLQIRSLKYDIEYSEEDVPITDETRENAVSFILEKRKELSDKLSAKEESDLAVVTKFIKSKKDYYNTLPSQSAKDKFIKNLQFKLEDDFNEYDLSKFTQPYVSYLLSDFDY